MCKVTAARELRAWTAAWEVLTAAWDYLTAARELRDCGVGTSDGGVGFFEIVLHRALFFFMIIVGIPLELKKII